MSEHPVMFIQCDWDDVIRKPEGNIWVSIRKRGEYNHEHGKIENAGLDASGKLQFLGTSGYSAEILANNLIKVEHKLSSTTSVFLAPTKIYTDIHKTSIPCLDVTSTGLCVSFCAKNKLVVWDFNRGELKLKLKGHVAEVYRTKFFPSEKVILTGGADMQLKIWCAETGICPVTLKGHKRAVTDFVMVDVGRNVISVSKDWSVKLWDCGESACLATLLCVSSNINCCAITSVPDSFPVGEPDKPPSGREIGTRNKVLLIGCEDGTAHGIAVYSRRRLFTTVLKAPVNSVEFFSKANETSLENLYAIGCQNGEILIYDLKNPKEPIKIVWDLNSPVLDIVSYKAVGIFVSHSEGSVYLLSSCDFRKIVYLTGPDCDPIYEMSTDGQFMYTACRDGVIRRYAIERALKVFES